MIAIGWRIRRGRDATWRSPGDLFFVVVQGLEILDSSGSVIDKPEVPSVARGVIRTRSVNHVRVMDQHITGFDLHGDLRKGRRIGRGGQSTTGSQDTRGRVRKDLSLIHI